MWYTVNRLAKVVNGLSCCEVRLTEDTYSVLADLQFIIRVITF